MPQRLKKVLLSVGIFCLLTTSADVALAEKWALSIGIDTYKSPKIVRLEGCVNDVKLIKSTLVNNFGFNENRVKTLTNAEATRDGIIRAIREHLVENVAIDDIVVIHFSGHGSRIRDITNGDEIDGWDETIVPYDSRQDKVFDITDDEINALLGELTKKTKNVIVFLDSCHSGSGIRGGTNIREIEPDTRIPRPAPLNVSTQRRGDGESGMKLKGSNYILISGCLPYERSNEAEYGGRRHGALTWYLTNAMMKARSGATYKSVFEDAAADVQSDFTTQTPQIEGPGQNFELFGLSKIPSRISVRVKDVVGDNVLLSGGKAQLLGKGAILEVYEEGNDDPEKKPKATIEVISAQDFTADGKIVEGGEVSPGAKAVLAKPSYGVPEVPMYIHPEIYALVPELKTLLSQYPIIRVVNEKDKEAARFFVAREEDELVILGGDLQLRFPPIPVKEEDFIHKLADQLSQLSHWLGVRGLKNNTRGAAKVSISLSRKGQPIGSPTPDQVLDGEELTLRVSNHENYSMYIYILDVSSDGSVSLLYDSESDSLPPQSSWDMVIKPYVTENHEAVVDTFKVIASVRQINSSIFPQGQIRNAISQQEDMTCTPEIATASGLAVLSGDDCAVVQDYVNLALRGQRPAMLVRPKSWGTDEKIIKISRSRVGFAGFAVHLNESRKLDLSALGVRAVCKDGKKDDSCYSIATIDKTHREWELRGAARGKRGTEDISSVGQAFDEAYSLQEKIPGALRVEPILEVTMSHAKERTDALVFGSTRSSGGSPPEEAAREDDEWSLKMIKARQAWEKLRTDRGVKAGEEAKDVLIAHVDTGYRHHPEVWAKYSGWRPIIPEQGYDYYSDDDNPWDEMLDSKILDTPGHGTTSGSVIVSPPGCQIEDPDGCVTGVAPGAQLIPLRVQRTVAQINTHNIAKAINDVANKEIAGDPKLISIAMGGPPTLSLKRAVDNAAEKGILIVAAAGNQVRMTVWPARFTNTIAVSAVNVHCRPWQGSSFGRRVDISAPGQDVWRASMFHAGGSTLPPDNDVNPSSATNAEQKLAYDIWMGNGTTYATGNTSGAAALWIAYHNDSPLYDEMVEDGAITSVFRQALLESAWRPDRAGENTMLCNDPDISWDSSRYGAGILDVEKLLLAPLQVQAEKLKKDESELLPLFASIYPVGSSSSRIESDYLKFFQDKEDDVKRLDPLARFETELMFHYTMNEKVRQSIDQLISGQRDLVTASAAAQALLKQDLSRRFRDSLRTVEK